MIIALACSLILNLGLIIWLFTLWLVKSSGTDQPGVYHRHGARSPKLVSLVLAELEPFEELEYQRLFAQESKGIKGVSDRLDELENMAQLKRMAR